MTSAEVQDFINSVSWQGSKLGLSRTRTLLERLGNPQRDLKFVHIAGTNGKGSTASMIDSALTAAGLRSGLYTSPYLFRFSERMKVNGREIPDEDLARLTEQVAPIALSMEDRPTEFEIITALGMLWFKEQGCDIVVLEVGMGGLLDSTNVIEGPLCSVITRIGLDHTDYLGKTLEEIALQKAGIIKPSCPTVVYPQEPSVMAVFEAVCAEKHAPMTAADFSEIEPLSFGAFGQTFRYRGEAYQISLLGDHQLQNAALAIETLTLLGKMGLPVTGEAIRTGLAAARWPARFEIVSQDPLFIVDGGHNPQGAETVSRGLRKYFPNQHVVLLTGVLSDKDYAGVMDILNPCADEFVAVTPHSPRALPARELGEFLKRYGKPVTVCDTIEEGVDAAAKAAKKRGGLACAVGSLYMAGFVRNYLGLE